MGAEIGCSQYFRATRQEAKEMLIATRRPFKVTFLSSQSTPAAQSSSRSR